MILSVQENGDVKSIPSRITQGSFVHDVTVVAPFVNTTCILRLKPPSEEWLDDIVMAPTLTTDGRGAIFTGSIPDKVATVAGRLLYHLEFVGGNGESVSSESGSISVLPGVITDVPNSAKDLSKYSLNQIYSLLSRISGNVIGIKKSVKKMMTSIPATLTIPVTAWENNRASAELAAVRKDSVVSISFDPAQAGAYIAAGIICIGQSDGVLYFSCETVPDGDISIRILVMDALEIEEGDDGEEEYYVVADYVTPQDYGATGDGETDDYEAFAKMFSENPKYVYIPAGEYYLSSVLTIPDGVKVIKGAGKNVTTIKSNHFITSGEGVKYGLCISDLTINPYDDSEEETCCIAGGFRYCNFVDLIIWGTTYGINLTFSSWTNTFTRCEISHCGQGIRMTSTENNNNIFNGCWLENNEYALYSSSSGGKNIAFEGCLLQNNQTAFRTVGMPAFVVRDSYIENNDTICEIYTACYGSLWTIENCFIYSDKEHNGWFLKLPAIATVPNQNIAMLNIEKCYIRHASADYKPFAFHEADAGGKNGQIAVNINDCTFYQQPKSYIDLFDTTVATLYGSGWNRLPIKTDLVYYQTDTCKWFLRSGNGSRYGGEDRYFELFGYLVPNQANSADELDGCNVEIPAVVGKVENAYLGGRVSMETITEDTTYLTSMVLDSVTIGGLHFSFGVYDTYYMLGERLYVTGLKY